MAGKNDVEMIVRAKDATGPGLDSARDRLRKFGSDTERMAGTALKFGAAVQGLQGAFTAATAGAALFRGDMDAVGSALERLPLGVGGVIREMRAFADSFNEPARKAAAMVAELEKLKSARVTLSEEITIATGGDSLESNRIRLTQERRNRIRALESEQEKIAPKDRFRTLEESNINTELLGQIEITKQLFALKDEALRAADFERQLAENRTSAEKESLANEKKRLDNLKQINRELDQADANRRVIPRNRFAELDNPGPGDTSLEAIRERMAGLRSQRPGGSGLASGEQSRFLTGLRESSRESQARVENEQLNVQKQMLEKLSAMEAELKAANEPANAATQLNLSFGALGGLS